MSNSTEQPQASATIRLIGQEMANHEVPALILVRTLSGLQQIIYLLAASQQQYSVEQRFRLSEEIKQLYTLRCQLPQPGSYAIPTVLKPSSTGQLTLLTEEHTYQSILDNLENILLNINNFNLSDITAILPDSKLRNRVFREFRKLLPKADEDWQFGFKSLGNPEVILTNKAVINLDGWLNQDTPEDAALTVTGDLIRIDFDSHLLVLRYPPTHREIECIYLEELEDSLIENRRQKLQVTGQFTVDAEGHPIKLTDVTRIEPVNLAPIIIQEVPLSTSKLVFKTPLRLTPTLDEETSQLFVIDYPDIGLNVFAYTREEIRAEISEQIAFLWTEYAQADEADLATDAQKLRGQLLAEIEEVKNAALER